MLQFGNVSVLVLGVSLIDRWSFLTASPTLSFQVGHVGGAARSLFSDAPR